MHHSPSSRNLRFISLLTLVFAALISIFIVYNERQTVRESSQDTHNYGELLASYLWDLNTESATDYVALIAEKGQFSSVSIQHPDHSTFVKHSNHSPPSELDKCLRSIHLIRDIISHEPITHKGKVIGEISTSRANKNIYTYSTLALLAFLGVAVAALVRHNKYRSLQHKQVEHDLSENKIRLDTVVSASPVISFSLDLNGVFTVCEGMGLNKLNNKSLNIIGKSLEDVAQQMPTSKADFLKALEGKCFSEIRTTDNRTFETWYSPVRENYKITGVTGVSTDVTAIMHAMNSLDDLKRTQDDNTQLARLAHKSLLPASAPSLQGYEIGFICKPSNKIGGDYIQFSPSAPPAQLAVTISEMSGHGLSSALLASIFHTQLARALDRTTLTLSEKFLQLNQDIHEHFPEGRFASTFHACIDSSDDTLRYIKASREPAILCPKGASPVMIDKGGPALGLLPTDMLSASSYEERSVKLKSGDSLLIYSDGLAGIENHCGNMIERKLIIQWLTEDLHLPPQAIVDSLYRKVISHAAGAEIIDDISLLILRKL